MATYKNDGNTLIRFLLEKGHLTQEDSEKIQQYVIDKGVTPNQALKETGAINDEIIPAIVEYTAKEQGLEYVFLDDSDISPEAVAMVTQDFAKTNGVFAYQYDSVTETLKVAVPINLIKKVQLKADLRKMTNISMIEFVVSDKKGILKNIEDNYRNNAELRELSEKDREEASAEAVQKTLTFGEEINEESRVITYVNLILEQAVKDKASDIHFDPAEDGLHVRYRIDGSLEERFDAKAPTRMRKEITSRIKIMANLDISKSREPQDGRLSLNMKNSRGDDIKIDFRIATLPSQWGEKIVMRILDNSSAQKSLDELGFSQYNLDRFYSAARKPYGMVLVTGPTGSGKSTTLYATLNSVKSPEINVITVEDPVEYTLEGITQVEVSSKMTFEQVLRTVLRADPDTILVGEIRDKETASIAMKAGMTGHMVYSTLHTNTAAETLSRLMDMDVEPFIISSTVEAIQAQRLVKRLCQHCKEPRTYETAELEAAGVDWKYWTAAEQPQFYRAVGCKHCKRRGYAGRMGVHEVLLMNEGIQEAILKGAKALELHRIAVADGMMPLKQDGFMKAAQGITTIEEIEANIN